MKLFLAAATAFAALALAPPASAQAHDPRTPFWIIHQLRFTGQQGTITFGAIPCPAGEAFHLTQVHAIPTHTKLPADLAWTVSMTVTSNLGWKFPARGDNGASYVFPAPMPFATGGTLAQKVTITFETPVTATWRYFTIGLLGVCKALPPAVSVTLS
jgi:hypothetical protein